jgi:CRISPR-associated endonuclease/helicase Cas3
MSNYEISLKSVYSRTVPTPEELKIPSIFSLHWHQVETYKALCDPDIEVIINTAMTGDGKSLAAFLAAMTKQEGNACKN